MIHSVNFAVKELDNQFVADAEIVLLAKNHTAGTVQVVAHMINGAWHSLRTINVPVVIVDFGHPDGGTNFNAVNILIETFNIIDIKNCDVSIVEIYIACCGQCNVCGQSGCGRQNVWRSQTITLTPYIVQQNWLVSIAWLLWLNYLY